MATPEHHTGPGTYFVTTATANRRSHFQVTANADLLIATLQHYRSENKYKLHAYVVMRDHVHLLLTPIDIPIERAIALIKGGYSHSLHAPSTIWQRGYTARRILTREEFIARRIYIHMNPVRAHLAGRPEDYPHSSAFRPPLSQPSPIGPQS